MRINRSLITYLPTSGAGSGTVTSVALTASVPTGLSATVTGSPITASGTLALSIAFAAGYGLPTTIQMGNWDTAYNFVSAFPTGTASQLLRYNTLGTALEFFTPNYLTSITATTPLVYNSGTNTISIPQANNTNDGYLTSADWLTFSSKQPAITLTTTGNSGASTFNGITGALNIPEYTLAGLGGMSNPMTTLGDIIYSNAAGAPLRRAGNITTTKMFLSSTGDGTNPSAPVWEAILPSTIGAVPTSRTLTINGVTYDLTANRSWTISAGVSSVGLTTSTTAITITGSPITSSGTLTLDIQTASSTQDGLLSSIDWNAFNAKMNSPLIGLGDMIYSNALGAALRLAPNTTTTKKFLSMTGSGTTGAAPQWSVISGSIISDGFQIDYDSNVSGLRNSSNKVFTVSVNFVSGSTRVFVNGLRYTNGASYDYTETGTNQITFTNAPDSGDLIIVEYIKA
jgi:hypothetical protein